VAVKKSELYGSIWKSCDELRGGMDASQYKDYVLILLFVKYVSDKYEGKENVPIYIPPGGSFKDMVAVKGQKDIGDRINKIIGKLAEANGLKGVIDVTDFNDANKLGSSKAMQDRLTNLVAIFENENLDFSKNRVDGDDLLGDSYEYLMRHFATESGKSKGQFYTPAEVSRVIAKVIGIHESKVQYQTLYDPTCGSGSLLLKAADEAPLGITIYGQEMDNATSALAKMNMILHGHPTAEIWNDNTLSHPHFLEERTRKLMTFDFAVANPPFSSKAWGNGVDPVNEPYERFKGFGIPPDKKGDYAFLLHLVRSLKSNGKGAIILPHGVLFRGNAEAQIRKNLILRGYIKGIIGLPAKLFYGTGIPACIIVIDKENAAGRHGIFMIDAGNGYVKDGNKNRLREQDIHKIVDVFNNQKEVPHYSRMVSPEEIEQNGFNLNIPRYIDTRTAEDLQDIEAHLKGDIPHRDIDDLGHYWEVLPSLKGVLFTGSPRKGYVCLKIPAVEIKAAVYSHPGFVDYTRAVTAVFDAWKAKHTPALKAMSTGIYPKTLINGLAEDILQAFAGVALIDAYDVYQHLLTYWVESMQDDVYLVAVDGWLANPELVPAPLLMDRYFDAEQKALRRLEADRDAFSRQKEELEEEQGGEEGLLAEVISEKGKISKGSVLHRIKEIEPDADAVEELTLLREYAALLEKEAEANRQIKEAQKALDKKVDSRYKALKEEDIKTLVVDDKWMTAMDRAVKTEMERISQRLTRRIIELAERYAVPLPQLNQEVEALTEKVDGHLQRMGFQW